MKQIQKFTYHNMRCMHDCTPTGIHLYFDVMGPLTSMLYIEFGQLGLSPDEMLQRRTKRRDVLDPLLTILCETNEYH